jgi:hypothetical protein
MLLRILQFLCHFIVVCADELIELEDLKRVGSYQGHVLLKTLEDLLVRNVPHDVVLHLLGSLYSKLILLTPLIAPVLPSAPF